MPLSLSPLFEIPTIYMYRAIVPLDSTHFSPFPPFCSPELLMSIVVSSSLLIISATCSNLILNSPSIFLNLLLYFSAPEFFVPFYNLSLYWYLNFIHCFLSLCLLLALWAGLLKTLFSKSNTWASLLTFCIILLFWKGHAPILFVCLMIFVVVLENWIFESYMEKSKKPSPRFLYF